MNTVGRGKLAICVVALWLSFGSVAQAQWPYEPPNPACNQAREDLMYTYHAYAAARENVAKALRRLERAETPRQHRRAKRKLIAARGLRDTARSNYRAASESVATHC